MPATGYIQVHAYTSYAQIPLQDVAVTVTDAKGSAIAMRLTDRSGRLDAPIEIETPNRTESLSPNASIIPFARVNIYARLDGYEAIEAENVQIFADTVTLQNLEMIPLSEFPDRWDKTEIFNTPPQNL